MVVALLVMTTLAEYPVLDGEITSLAASPLGTAVTGIPVALTTEGLPVAPEVQNPNSVEAPAASQAFDANEVAVS